MKSVTINNTKYFFKKLTWLDIVGDSTIAGENELKMLTIPHLKKYIQAEWDTFKKYLQQELKDHHIEAKGSQFCQLVSVLCYSC
mgnify:CR=1 FL=1